MHSLVKWRARKYEEERPWEKWLVLTVVAATSGPDSVIPDAIQGYIAINMLMWDEEFRNKAGVKDSKFEDMWNTMFAFK
jgi:hypothetical protein